MVAGNPMAVTVHALLLLSLPLAIVAVCILTRRTTWGRSGFVWAGAAAVVAYVAAGFVFVSCAHLCDAGDPVSQTMIGGCCLWLVLVVPRFIWLRLIVAVLLIVAMFGLSRQYGELVHTKGLTGNAISRDDPGEEGVRLLSSVRAAVRKAVPPATQPYAAGWVRDMRVASDLCRSLDRPIRIEITPFWHSWYSRLYKHRVVYQDFWFGGGVLPDRANEITLRDRDDAREAR